MHMMPPSPISATMIMCTHVCTECIDDDHCSCTCIGLTCTWLLLKGPAEQDPFPSEGPDAYSYFLWKGTECARLPNPSERGLDAHGCPIPLEGTGCTRLPNPSEGDWMHMAAQFLWKGTGSMRTAAQFLWKGTGCARLPNPSGRGLDAHGCPIPLEGDWIDAHGCPIPLEGDWMRNSHLPS